MQNSNLGLKKRIIIILMIVSVIWVILFIRVGIIQFVEGEDWKRKSENQQYVSRSITAGRGTIYDASGEHILAKSSSVETVTVNPVNISKENEEKIDEILTNKTNGIEIDKWLGGIDENG